MVSGTESRPLTQDANSVGRQFEELLLKQVVECILPKGSGELYGGGTGASVWRSMLADGIAKELASRDIVGLQERLTNATQQVASQDGT